MPLRQHAVAVGKAVPDNCAMRTQQETVNERTHTHTLRVEDLHPAHQFAVLDLVINLQQVLVAIAVGRDNNERSSAKVSVLCEFSYPGVP